MSVYEVVTDKGDKYQVEVEDTQQQPQGTKQPMQKPQESMSEYKPTIKSNVRDYLAGYGEHRGLRDVAKPFNNLFLGNEPDVGGERARTAMAEFINKRTFGIPQAITQSVGLPFNKTDQGIAKASGGLVGMLGAFKGVDKGVGKVIQGQSLAPTAIRGAVSGALTGFATPPEQFSDMKARKTQATAGAIIGGALSALPKVVNFSGKKAGLNMAQKVDKVMDSTQGKLSQNYDNYFSSIKGSTDKYDDIIETGQQIIDEYPTGANMGKVKNIVNRLKGFKKSNRQITAEELHNIKQEVRKAIPQNVWGGRVDPSASQAAQERLYWKITDKVAEIGGDEYKVLAKDYKKYKDGLGIARKYFTEQGLPSEGNMTRPLSLARERLLKDFESELVPTKDRFMSDFMSWRRGQAVKKAAQKVSPWALGGWYAQNRLRKGFGSIGGDGGQEEPRGY